MKEPTSLPCELIQDILPLYVEEDVNPKTKDLVAKHLEECGSCRDFLKELKNEEPVLDDIPENLPEPDTFRKWFKRLRAGAIAGLIILILAAVGIGVVSYKAGTVAEKETIGTKDVVRVLKKAGLSLKASQSPVIDPNECLLGDIRPKVYNLDEEGFSQLYIYEFESTLARKKTIEGIERQDNPFMQRMSHRAYAAKNMVLVMTFNVAQENMENMEQAEKIFAQLAPITFTLGKTVFYDLNQGEKWVLYGEGEHWEAKLVVAAFEEKWIDEKGYKQSRYYVNKTPFINYKGNPEEIEKISYGFQHGLHGQRSGFEGGFRQGNFDEEQTHVYGGSPIFWGEFGFSQTYIVDKNEPGQFSAEWNGEEESFELTLQES
ncbi:hypothetical protein Dhaf_1113 [Desulfitobacterium hafniense DCB-2]|uniref:Zinc-finger domain-containing protein n=1 Tax=Desulfitobacterium hafniense (strain DSM 10664 / DCB-2) TaxID=272564 RepID=B8FZU9_DESHD|nr:DUF2275 domain-containing protein [Desulfitobacterium hafniense]ACL19173.1 hypothetical protein Dhaf_1113 [Desulfitobacterium hafniense DCB-2]